MTSSTFPLPLTEPWRLLRDRRALVVAGLAALVLAYCRLFSQFFPTSNGRLGNDYSYFLPGLFDGYCWFHVNGLRALPWFTPSFAGGTLGAYTNVQRSYFSVPQFLTFVVDPLTAIRLTMFVMAAVGAAGSYLLLRRAFRLSRGASLVGAGLFLFNGFYGHRMVVGHLGYHTYMFVPVAAYFLLRPLPAAHGMRTWRLLLDATIAGLAFAAMAMSDLITILPAVVLSIAVVGLVHGLLTKVRWDFWSRFLVAGGVGIALTAGRLVAIVSFLTNLPRSQYPLPGAKSLPHALGLVLRCLFVSPAWDSQRMEWMEGVQWGGLDRHEWEYSMSIVALALVLLGAWKLVRRARERGWRTNLTPGAWLQAGIVAALLLVPVLVNTRSPATESIVKSVPLLSSSSVLVRWFVLYIPVVTVAAALAYEHCASLRRRPVLSCAAALGLIVAVKSSVDRSYYTEQQYDPRPILTADCEVRSGARTPEIREVGIFVEDLGAEHVLHINQNDLVAKGQSQIFAYDATFGYVHENVPFKTLHPGPCLAATNGVLNVKNPAYYLWPDENGGEPGDHFTVAQTSAAIDFLQYRPFPFEMSAAQRAANWVNAVALVGVSGFLIVTLVRFARARSAAGVAPGRPPRAASRHVRGREARSRASN